VQSADARACLGRPAGAAACEVWREAPFSFVREGAAGPEIVSGRFDRLVIERGGDGRAAAATVVDFKSNRVQSDAGLAEAAAGYAGQMRDYAAAAGRLLGLRPEQVKTLILFTRANRVWQV
jgi:ATP-dependent exoDNAse (exonuclease V) beta subunit